MSISFGIRFGNHQEPEEEAPVEPTSLLDIVTSSKAHTILGAAVARCPDVARALETARDVTLVAPTDAAFKALLAALGLTADQLLASKLLATVLKYHVTTPAIEECCEDAVGRDTLVPGQTWKRVWNDELMKCNIIDGAGNSALTEGDVIRASNGNTLIVADSVLVPAGVTVVDGDLVIEANARMGLSRSFVSHEFTTGHNHH